MTETQSFVEQARGARRRLTGLFALLLGGYALGALVFGQTTNPQDHTPFGSVEGTVLDGAGKPLSGATVYALSAHDVSKQVRAQTDARGVFLLKRVPVGEAYVDAFKEEDWYPYNFFAFFLMPRQGASTKATIAEGKTTSGVTIRLGAKAAVLHLTITDENGTPVTANAEFERPDLGHSGNYGTSLQPNQRLLVPPVPFRLRIERKGYEAWRYTERKDGLVRLESGQSLDISVRLRKEKSNKTARAGSIRGTVVGKDGRPVARAVVYAAPEGRNRDGRLTTTTTATGTFTIDDVTPGTFRLWASEADVGTHELSSPFFAGEGQPLPTVIVAAGEVITADVRLGPKTGFLNLLITDDSGAPIHEDVHVVLSRLDSLERLERQVRNREFIQVPSTALQVSVAAKGYAEWHYGSQQPIPTPSLTVDAGEIRDLRVHLRPLR